MERERALMQQSQQECEAPHLEGHDSGTNMDTQVHDVHASGPCKMLWL